MRFDIRFENSPKNPADRKWGTWLRQKSFRPKIHPVLPLRVSLMAFKEETSVHPVSPPKPPGVAETIEYEIAASDLVELAHAKHRLKALSARNTELAALCAFFHKGRVNTGPHGPFNYPNF